MKRISLLILALTFALAACAPKAPQPQESTGTEKKAVLVVSFGTSYNETRAATIDAVEKKIADAYPDYKQYRAFTSQTIIDKLAERDGLKIDNVTQAMDRLVADGVTTLVVQPTHVMNGFEYDDMMAEVQPYEGKFQSVVYGKPLLSDDTDYTEVVKILAEETKQYNRADTVIVWMGHGSEHPANDTYTKLQKVFFDAGYNNYFVGTVEAKPDLTDMLAKVKASGAKKVVLLPLMIVAGDHATNDLAGDEEGSWKTAFKGEGYEVECVLRGLGEYTGVQELFVAHAGAAMGK